MANKTVYPFGTNGTLPGNIKLVDYHIGGRDKALDAESGKELHEMILERTDTYGEILPSVEYGSSTTISPSTGEITTSSYSQSHVNEFPIDLVNNKYLGSYGFGGAQTTSYSLYYYDENFTLLGGACINPGSDPATAYTLRELEYPSSWTGNEDYYKALTKFIRIVGFTGSREAKLYETWTVPQSILARAVTPNVINIFVATIQTPFYSKSVLDNTEIVGTETPSPWGIIFPSTYTVGGTPTPVIAMLHGSNGYVSEGCLGYTSGGWITQRDAYLAAGFAVMDINGYGVSTEADAKSKHWGCPLAVETLDKAWEFLRHNFNVCERLLLAGTSMGGVLAMSYAKAHPGKVAAVGLFAPNLLAYSIRFVEDATKFTAWGYADKAEAEADDYNELSGYVLLNECQVAVGESGGVISQFEWSDYDDTTKEQILSLRLIDRFPVTMRIWQGASDASVPSSNSVLLFNSLMRGNSPVSIRVCNGAGHDLASYSYVRNEAVSFFKRFAVQYP